MKACLFFALAGLFLCACSSESEATGPTGVQPGEQVASSLPREASPDATDQELMQLATDNAAFGWDFYQEAVKDDENLFFSPYSLSVALAMTWAGARGNTEAEMANALNFTLGQQRLHPAFNALDLTLAARAEAGGENAPMPFRLNVTNALFSRAGLQFLDPFLDTLAAHYGAGLMLLDFNQAEDARQVINQWVAEQTENRIDELLEEGIVSARTLLVLVNTIYFTASWAEPFDEANTSDDPFTRLDGTVVTAETMHRSIPTSYVDGTNYQAAEIPYDGNQLSMLLIVPDEGAFEAVESTMSGSTMAQILGELTRHQVELSLPKFSFRSQVPAKKPLEALGMLDAFSSAADLSGMNGARGLLIDNVVHEGFIAVDENGTEAAAATAVIIDRTSAPPSVELTADRPFIFAIIDRPTGAMLFAGRVLNPIN